MRRFLLLALSIVLLVLISGPVSAHGYLIRAIPQDRARLEHPPPRLQYWFSEALEANFSSVSLRDEHGDILAEGGVDPDNASRMSLIVPSDLPDGAYIVDLRSAFASDGHVVAEARVFFVGETAADLAGSSGSYAVVPLEVVWRALLYASSLLLMGTFALYAYILVPAWGSAAFPAGLLPPRVMRRLTGIAIAAWMLSLIANLLAMLQQSMVYFNTAPAEVISRGLWQIVRIGSRFGDMWSIRMLLLLILAISMGLAHNWRKDRPETVRAFWTANVWLMALLIGGFSVASHAAGSLTWPWIAMLVNWAHTLAVGLWIGGLLALVLVLPVALRPYEGDARRHALFAALRRFSRLAVIALIVVVATGLYSASNWLYQPSDLTQSSWGAALIIKSALVGSVVALGALHFLATNPERFAPWQHWRNRLPATLRTLPFEALLALILLVSVALLSASAVPEPTALTRPDFEAPQASTELDDLSLVLTISPGGPGINSISAVVRQGNTVVNDAVVVLQLVYPALDWRTKPVEMPLSGEGLYVAAGDEISSAGEWWTLLDVLLPGDRAPQRIAFAWDIDAEASIPTELPPRLSQSLALLAVIAALALAAYPSARKLVRWLDWHPASVATAAAAIVLTAAIFVLGISLVNQSQRQYQALLRPPPQRINPVLPDAASLAAGEELFLAECSPWNSQRRELLAYIADKGDEAIYDLTEQGWRDLSPCVDTLGQPERWHIVNYIRSLEES